MPHMHHERQRIDWTLFSTAEATGHSSITNTNLSSSSPVVATNSKSSTRNAATNVTESDSSTFAPTPIHTIKNNNIQQTNLHSATTNYSPKIPKHIGLICDGNGRWATQRNLPRAAGHLEGARRLVNLIKALVRERKNNKSSMVDCITLYAFSTENWNRSPSEISKIFEAIEVAARMVKTIGELAKVDVKVLGDLSDNRIPKSLRNVLLELEERGQRRQNNDFTTKNLQVCLAVNYGGRRDIVSACRSLAQAVKDGTLSDASEITEDLVQDTLSTGGITPPDLIVRTGGEHRLSNFLLWEAAYAELYVSPVLWPDFTWEGEWKDSLEWYSQRKRNFGGRNDDTDPHETEAK